MNEDHTRQTYTVAEAAMLLGVGRSTAYDLVQRSELPAVRLGRRWLITARALEDLLGERPPIPSEIAPSQPVGG